ncbi:MAG: SusC/RagA family TonB-linked outer membrane protein, partial [Bacteroidota bacterium]|nr:SusC/RagA family TonB-linked outer membrane protein [Bacteroidota bacterium]
MNFKALCKLPPGAGISLSKTLLTMKLSFVLLIVTSFQLSAKSYSQNITVRVKNASLEKIFDQIQRQTDYRFFYKDELLEEAGRVDLDFRNAPLKEVLDACFREQPLTYTIIDKTILIKRKTESSSSAVAGTQPPALIGGQITDEAGRPLSGVSVKNTTTGNGMATNDEGKFSIEANLNDVLEFSFVGYKTQKLKITSLNQSVSLSMQVEVSSLANTVVIGYGVVKRSDLTGSVSSVNNTEVNRTATGDLVRALEGQVAGVQIMQPSGTPGGSAIIRVRGANSLTGGNNDPLYVVDGMILSKLGSDFNANDVQSIQILKDASATAIYGSRGSNGVVIITTKRGIPGKTQISYDGYVGVQKLIKKLDLLNAAQYKDYYLQSRHNATINTSIDTSITNSLSNTDWQNEIYHNALIQNHTISVRGGTGQSRYFTSVNYFRQDGIIRNTDFTRFSVRFNGDQAISDRFQLSENILLSYNQSDGILGDEVVSNGAAWARPTQPVLDAGGNPSMVSLPYARTNPRALVDEVVNQSQNYRVVANLVLDYKIFKGLTAKVNVGTEDNIPLTNYYVPTNLTESGFIGSARKTYGSNISWINENTLNYSTQVGRDHLISAVAGITFQDTKNDFLQGASNGYIINGFQYNNLAAGTIQTSA